jgi:hypothetical protein
MQSYGYARIILPLSSAIRWLWTEAASEPSAAAHKTRGNQVD